MTCLSQSSNGMKPCTGSLTEYSGTGNHSIQSIADCVTLLLRLTLPNPWQENNNRTGVLFSSPMCHHFSPRPIPSHKGRDQIGLKALSFYLDALQQLAGRFIRPAISPCELSLGGDKFTSKGLGKDGLGQFLRLGCRREHTLFNHFSRNE